MTLDGQAVGTVEVKREGLYCRISCRCRILDGGILRLYADGEKLGVLAPENGMLTLETRLAAKHLKPGCAFTLDGAGKFYPICQSEKFSHLDKLRGGKLSFREGKPGLLAFPQ